MDWTIMLAWALAAGLAIFLAAALLAPEKLS